MRADAETRKCAQKSANERKKDAKIESNEV